MTRIADNPFLVVESVRPSARRLDASAFNAACVARGITPHDVLLGAGCAREDVPAVLGGAVPAPMRRARVAAALDCAEHVLWPRCEP